MRTQSIDTNIEVEKILISLLRNLSVSKRLSKMENLVSTTIKLSRRAILRANPLLNKNELDLLFVKYHYGEDLTNRLRDYINKKKIMKNSEIIEALDLVIKSFDEIGIKYYIGGSVASSAYGIARTTMDIDLVSNLKIFQVNQLADRLKGTYFIDESMILDAIKTNSSFNLIHLDTMIKIDVFILKDKPFPLKAFERKRKDKFEVEDNTIEVYLSSPEDIILNKLEWFRLGGKISERQWLDVLGVIKIQGELLDKEYLSFWAEQIEISDLLTQALLDAGN